VFLQFYVAKILSNAVHNLYNDILRHRLVGLQLCNAVDIDALAGFFTIHFSQRKTYGNCSCGWWKVSVMASSKHGTSYSPRCLWTSGHMTCCEPISKRAETRADSYNNCDKTMTTVISTTTLKQRQHQHDQLLLQITTTTTTTTTSRRVWSDLTMALAAPINVSYSY